MPGLTLTSSGGELAGERIAAARKRAGLTQQQLAARLRCLNPRFPASNAIPKPPPSGRSRRSPALNADVSSLI